MTIYQKHRETITRIVTKYGGSNIRVFGSMVRRENRESSDLDLLIELEKGRSLLELIEMQQDLEDILGCKVDIVTEGGISPFLKDHIYAEAIPL